MDLVMTPLVLRSTYRRRAGANADSAWFGTFDLELASTSGASIELPTGSRLALWCTMQLEPVASSGVRKVERLAGHLVLEPTGCGVWTTSPWRIGGLQSRFPARHANDGPEAAWVILPDHSTIEIDVEPSRATNPPSAVQPDTSNDARDRTMVPSGDTPGVSVTPHPRHVMLNAGAERHQRARLVGPTTAVAETWSSVADLGRRAGWGVLDPIGADSDATPTTVTIVDELAEEAYDIDIANGAIAVRAGGDRGGRHGLVTLSQLLTSGGGAPELHISDEPGLAFRGVHLDLARRWFEPDVVERLIDIAAWRKLSHVHLHLTDDEAWRFHVDAYPTLATIGGTRGHGLALAPLCGSGPAPYGRAYSGAEIGRWVQRADALGITLVPEVDVPGHCHAALIAVPELRDPDDASTAVSVQGYPNNVLVPGLSTTMPFLEAVFTTLAELFPNSPTLHIGGDEVPPGSWDGSPATTAYAAARDLTSTSQVEAAFHRDLIDMIAATTGRGVAMWEEAALAGVEPSGYAVAWTSADAGVRLARAGHRVVMAPGQTNYLDMAPGRAWELPGGSWAGNVTLADTCTFDPTIGWADDIVDLLHGVQACIWSEHIADLDILDTLTFPRLDAIAERGWTGRIVGGPEALADRSAALPRFTA